MLHDNYLHHHYSTTSNNLHRGVMSGSRNVNAHCHGDGTHATSEPLPQTRRLLATPSTLSSTSPSQ